MDCTDIHNKTEDYLLENLTNDQELALEKHCEQCSDCTQHIAEIGSTILSFDQTENTAAFDRCFSAVQEEIKKDNSGWSLSKIINPTFKRVAACVIALGIAAALYTTPSNSDNDLKLSINWKQDGNLLTNHNDRPIIRDGKVFTLRNDSGENQLIALNKSTGEVCWEQPIGLTTRLVADDNQIYTGQLSEGTFSIAALSIDDGHKKWDYDYKFRSAQKKNFSFQIAGGRLNWIVDRTLHSFDAQQGELLWKRRLNKKKESYALPIYDNGKLHIAGSRNMYTVEAKTGSILNQQPHEELYTHYLKPRVTIKGDKLFVSANSAKGVGRVICYNKDNGKKMWQKNVDKIRTLQASHGLLIVKNKKLEAFDQVTGNLVWSDPIGGCYEVAFRKDKIFAINSSKRHDIIALDTKTGNHVKSFAVSGQSCSGISIDGNDGFLTTNSGTLYAMSF